MQDNDKASLIVGSTILTAALFSLVFATYTRAGIIQRSEDPSIKLTYAKDCDDATYSYLKQKPVAVSKPLAKKPIITKQENKKAVSQTQPPTKATKATIAKPPSLANISKTPTVAKAEIKKIIQVSSYLVQVGVFSEKENALRLKAILEKKGLKPSVKKLVTGSKSRYQLSLGPYSSRKQAAREAKKQETITDQKGIIKEEIR